MRILFVADLFGAAGRRALRDRLPDLNERYRPDFRIVNCENAAGGFGFTGKIAEELFEAGFDVLTGGNHSWDRKESLPFLRDRDRVLRPANFPAGTPGRGWGVYPIPSGGKIGVLNLMGRVFLEGADCPFRAADAVLPRIARETPILFVDMHAEATSEKVAMGWHLDGRVSAVIGTHTHVQTADERLLPGGTAYITDAGMTGPQDSVIGVKTELILKRFLTQMPVRFEASTRNPYVHGVVVDVDRETGRSLRIERIREPAAVETEEERSERE
ncbi:MAG: TIGR00282 family metallophosphoesterase [Candidatus Eisenbacteria bacterium]|nr:TIGR00282 family metallophosphoesterase [Candidatus Eisenbacteria bacterium]